MKRRVGFTLIELLVVVSVIGILAAMLLPSLRSARRQAKQTACATNLRQIGVALNGYLNDYNDRLPAATFMPSIPPVDTEEVVAISDVLGPYVSGSTKVFHCPEDIGGRTNRDLPNTGKSYFETERSSYAYNTRMRWRNVNDVANQMREHGRTISANQIWLMRDYVNFHARGGVGFDQADEELPQGQRRNYLYVDGHVGDFES